MPHRWMFLALMLGLIACFDETRKSERSELGYSELMDGSERIDIVDNAHFVEHGEISEALAFNGSIILDAFTMKTSPERVDVSEKPLGNAQVFPGGEFDFFTYRDPDTSEDHLVPLSNDFLAQTGPHFCKIALLPGRVWKEVGDHGMTRAVFPFALGARQEGGGFIGLATFLYDGETVSQFRMQLVQQTRTYFIRQKIGVGDCYKNEEYANHDCSSRFLAWGQTRIRNYLRFVPTRIKQLEADYASELAARLPVKPFTDLVRDFPARFRENPELFEKLLTGFDGDTGGPDNNVVSGLVVDGTLYRKNCHTPLGPFPFCDVAVFGVQSVTKSMFASAALLNLAQEYGAAFLDRSVYIDDSGHKYLPEVDGVENEAARNIWKEMTLRHLSNMASGLAETPVDPEAHDMYAEFATSGHDLNAWDLEFEKPDAIGAKIAVAIRTPPMRYARHGATGETKGGVVGPGTPYSRYRSQDPFFVGVYLDRFVRNKAPEKSLSQHVREEIYRPLGIYRAPSVRYLTRDGKLSGVPPMHHGQHVSIDAMAKFGTLIANKGKDPRTGRQLLHAGALEEILPRTDRSGYAEGWAIETLPDDPGQSDQVHYAKFFHLWPYRNAEGCFYQYPQAQGFGGNLIAVFPNGMVGVRVAQNLFGGDDPYDSNAMGRLADFRVPFC